MNTLLQSRPFSIQELFAPPFQFVSPSFQRPFAWQDENAERLIGDILAAGSDAPDDLYFLGAILLVRMPLADEHGDYASQDAAFGGGERIFEIVDGQQRLVTMALLLAVLRDLLSRDGRAPSPLLGRLSAALTTTHNVPRVQLRGTDSAFLAHCIGETGACLVPPLDDAKSVAQLHLLEVRDFFANQLCDLECGELERLAEFVLDNCTIVAIVTNTIDRAYQMFTVLNDTGKQLTRSDILKADLISQTPPALRTSLTEVWDDLERRLGAKFEDLFSYVRTLDGRGTEPIVEAIRAIVAATPGGAAAFILEMLAPTGRCFDTILRAGHEGTAQSIEISRFLRYLNWLPGKEWIPPLLGYWVKHADDAALLLGFLRALDRFSYGARMLGLGGDKRAQRMAALTRVVQTTAAADGPWEALHFGRDELRAISFNLRDLHRRNPQICKLVLLRLNEQLGGAPMSNAMPLTIEHILPLKVAANSRWRIDFPDADERAKFAACLGNLTLVPGRVNDRASNHDFERKLVVYFDGSDEPICKLTAELRLLNAWGPLQIEARQARLDAALNQIWRFDAPRGQS